MTARQRRLARRSGCALVLALLMAAAETGLAGAEPPPVQTVRGLVRRQLPDGRLLPASSLRVTLEDKASKRRFVASIGWDGIYFFHEVPPGSYALSVQDKDKPARVLAVVITAAPYFDIPPVILAAPIRDYKEAYANARKAIDLRDWSGAAYVLPKVLEKHPEDAKSRQEQIRTAGNWQGLYRPHFYLGLALLKLGDCEGALREWQSEESLGPLETTYRDAIRSGRRECAGSKG